MTISPTTTLELSLELIDTHVHLDVAPLSDDLAATWSAAQRAGLSQAVTMGVTPRSWQQLVERTKPLPGVHHALGIHPQAVAGLSPTEVEAGLRALPNLLIDTGAVAVGECGLDGLAGELDRQEPIFDAQLAIARALELPLAIHVFRAHEPALRILRRHPGLRGVMHSFSGSVELLREYLKLGLSVSFAAAIARSNARKPLLAARAAPLERLLLETDAPFQPFAPDARDRRFGHPADLPKLLEVLAQLRGEAPSTIAQRTCASARELFGLAKPT